MRTTSSLIKLIIFALVTFVTFGTLAATIANISFGDRSTYTAVFSDVTGLAKGQDVRIAGVRVGEITKIGIDNYCHLALTFSVYLTPALTDLVNLADRKTSFRSDQKIFFA